MPGGPFAICKVDGQDLSAAMASAGMAWAAPHVADYSVQASNAMYAISGVYPPSLRQSVGVARRHPVKTIGNHSAGWALLRPCSYRRWAAASFSFT
jgi:hypothetical protein